VYTFRISNKKRPENLIHEGRRRRRRRRERRMASSGMLRRVTLVRTDVSEELSASIMMTRIGELGTTLALTSN
jgi:CelD/BcsL family acetyltransferase involved in cellulose biosynthesis